MSYQLNKTNGELLVDLVDGQIDTATTDITLVGKNYKGFGEFINENYIKMLENFSNTAAPSNPMTGQLWFDSGEQRLKIYTGSTFKSAGGPIVSNTQPTMVTGDIWIDNENNKMYFFDGTDLVLVGPEYSATQGKTGFEVVSVIDTANQDQTVLKLYIGGLLQGIWSKAEFRPNVNIPGFPVDPDDTNVPQRQILRVGFNPGGSNFWWQGTARNARNLVNQAGVSKSAENFLPSDANAFTTGSIRIKNSSGVSVGVGDTEYAILKIVGETTFLDLQRANQDFHLRVRSGNSQVAAIYADASSKYLGVWNSTPQKSLDVTGNGRFTGNLEVDGNLLVSGDTTYLNVGTLRVEDKHIELGLLNDSTEGNDAQVDGAGVIVRSSDGSKDLSWSQSTDSWTSNQNFDVATGKEYKIGGSSILNLNTLSSTVQTALGLTRVGTLQYLDVDNININGSTISNASGGLTLSSTGDLDISSQKITNVANPTGNADAANKTYVDTQIDLEPITTHLDITGLTAPSANLSSGGPYNSVIGILDFLFPASSKQNGTVARVHVTQYINTTVSGIDIGTAASKSFISVDSNGTQNESVVQDISFTTASGTATFTPTRANMTFVVSGGSWTWSNTAVL